MLKCHAAGQRGATRPVHARCLTRSHTKPKVRDCELDQLQAAECIDCGRSAQTRPSDKTSRRCVRCIQVGKSRLETFSRVPSAHVEDESATVYAGHARILKHVLPRQAFGGRRGWGHLVLEVVYACTPVNNFGGDPLESEGCNGLCCGPPKCTLKNQRCLQGTPLNRRYEATMSIMS